MGLPQFLNSARVQLCIVAALFFVLLFTIDRTVIQGYRKPVSQGGKNVHLRGGTPSPCFVAALNKFMSAQEHDGHSCTKATPPWGYWGKPPAQCLAQPGGIKPMPPGCAAIGVPGAENIPCPYNLPPNPAAPKTTDGCGNPIIVCSLVYNTTSGQNDTVCPAPPACVPDCIAKLSAACQKDMAPYSGPPYPCLTQTTMTSTQSGSMIFLYIVQSMYTAMGIAFFITYGVRIRNVTKPFLRQRAIAAWLAISYYFISWYPHSALHELYSGGDSWELQILTEGVFHWPMTIASGVLCYCQYDLLMMLYEVSVLKKGYKSYVTENSIRWYQNYKIQAMIATVIGYGFWLGLVYGIAGIPTGGDPGLEFWTKNLWNRCWPAPWQQFFLYTFWLVDSFVGGVGFGFLVLAVTIIRGLTDPKHKRLAVGSTIGIFTNLSISAFHSMVHNVSPPCIVNVIVIDYMLHLSLIASVCILAYYQWMMLDVQADPESALARGQAYRKAPSGSSKAMGDGVVSATASSTSSAVSNSSVSASATGSGSESESKQVEMDQI